MIIQDRYTPQGTLIKIHNIKSTDININTFVVAVLLSSWTETNKVTLAPDYEKYYTIDTFIDWKPEYLENMEEYLVATPEWKSMDTPYSQEQLSLFNNSPGLGYEWSYNKRNWVDKRSLTTVKKLATVTINNSREAYINSFDRFYYNGILYDGNKSAQENIRIAASVAQLDTPLPEGFSWRSFDNTDILMNKQQVLGLYEALVKELALWVFSAHEIARSLKDKIDLATTNKEVDAIVWPT